MERQKTGEDPASTNKIIRFKAGTSIVREGDPIDGLYVIKSGRVGIDKRILDNHISVETLEEGEFFGEHCMLGIEVESPRIVALEDTTLLYIPIQQVAQMLANQHEIAVQMMKKLCQRVTRLHYKITNYSMRSSSGRILHQLRQEAIYQHGQFDGEDIIIKFPDDMSFATGLEDALIVHLLKQLHSKNIIELIDDSSCRIPDYARYDAYLRYLELKNQFE